MAAATIRHTTVKITAHLLELHEEDLPSGDSPNLTSPFGTYTCVVDTDGKTGNMTT